ncbi:hypothetical protein J6590_066295 [Homalodisca vitripennis]|nr:hypothetical protein J6590_066295 [Homalodisca vitripennis]
MGLPQGSDLELWLFLYNVNMTLFSRRNSLILMSRCAWHYLKSERARRCEDAADTNSGRN